MITAGSRRRGGGFARWAAGAMAAWCVCCTAGGCAPRRESPQAGGKAGTHSPSAAKGDVALSVQTAATATSDDTAPPADVLRQALATVRADAQPTLTVTPTGAVTIWPEGGGQWQAVWLDRAGRIRHRSSFTSAAADTATPLLVTAAGTAWFARRGDAEVLQLTTTSAPQRRKLPAAVVGLDGQSNGDVVAVLQAADGARVVRIDGEGLPQWDKPVALPGAVTAVTVTLRDDVLLLGQRGGASPAWYAARLAQLDGRLLWLRVLEPASLPPSVEWATAMPGPHGAALLVSLARSGSRRDEPWTLLELDANGHFGWRTTLPRSAPVAVASGDNQRLLVAQGRSGGIQVHSYDGSGRAVTTWAADWRGIEVPTALASGPDGEVWSVSLAPHADGEHATVLVTRWAIGRPQRPIPCAPTGCSATRRDPDGCATLLLPDGAPCSPLSNCRGGQCGGPRPAPLPQPATE